ncbi:MAG: AAA family ATPase, partial [Planctomycetota bacterium]
TGIVGPNGCGKSNVVDAIKWVLGERSSKSLRGKEMIDVIFAGSAGRSPAGMARVALGFENPVIDADAEAVEIELDDADEPEHDSGLVTDTATKRARPARRRRMLPIEADEVEVERQLYRDGKSAYLINGKRARMRDIRELFMDTGIGADAYSIIEQGKVDRMLLASPQERRIIFEEAAGIAKYRQRRVEAERKLERTERNLEGTRTQLDNTERRLRIVRGQAEKARQFKLLDDELAANRLALVFHQYDELRQRLDGLTSQLSAMSGQRRETEARLRDAEDAKLAAEGEAVEAEGGVRALEDQRTAAEHTRQSAEQRISMSKRALEDAHRR